MHCIRIRALLCLMALLVSATVAAAELPISDFVKHPTLTNPVISPDGKYIAVAISQNSDSTDASYQLAVLQLPDLKPVSRLDMAPRYLPIGIHWVSNNRLIMALGRESGTLESPSGTGDIIAVDMDGTHKKTLYSLAHRGGAFSGANSLDIPRGSPSITALPNHADNHFALNLQVFPENSNGTDWDSSKSQLYDVDAASGHAIKIGEINHGSMNLIPYGGVARIAAGEDDQLNTEVFSSTDGKTWTRIPDAVAGKVFNPLRISDDGKLLFALSSMDGGPNQLIECNLDGTGRKVLASDPFSSVTEVMWNPVTHAPLAAVFAAGGKPTVQYIGDSDYVQIMQALATSQPSDFVMLQNASQNGSMLLIGVASDRNPGVFALFDKSTMNARPLYQVLPWIKPADMPQRKPVRFTNRSGTELVGFLTLPNGADKHLPLVLIPHGGPIGVADSWSYDPISAFLANRGYATLQVNYRGSSERGQNFQRTGFRQFGSGIQDDLIDGVQWAITQGYVDPNRICVFGGSFGGYSSLMQPILAPKLYKCAIDYAGVYDMRIEFNDSDTRRYKNGRTYLKMAVGTQQDAYAISPVSMMDKFNVPVLIAHGKDDPRVPYKNATDLRSYLDKAGKPYEWLAAPKELHGFYSEKNNEELFGMIQAFLAKYIGSGNMAAAPAAPK